MQSSRRRGPAGRRTAVLAAAALVLPLIASGASAAPAALPSTQEQPASTAAPETPPGTGVLPSMAAEGSGLVRLQVGAFDPLAGAGPDQAGVARLDEAALDAGTSYPWLVQVEGALYAEATAAVEGAGAQVLGAVPDATYVVRATPAQRAELAASPSVRWSGLLQPAWKLPVAAPNREALLSLPGTQTYRVYGFRGTPEAAALAGVLDALDGVAVETDAAPVVDVRATAAQLPAIAALPGVQWVGVKPTVVPHNAEARWVTDTGVRDVRWASRDDRLTGAGQTAAVADTGVNYTYDLNDRAHAAFRDCADASAPRTDAVGECKLADYTQTTAGNSTEAVLAVTPNRTGHRKMAAYFDIGNTGVSPRDDSAHGTHVAGSVSADYLENGRADGQDGMAPASRLVFQAIGTSSGGLSIPADDYQLFRQAYRPSNPADVPEVYTPEDYAKYKPLEDARTHNNSYGTIVPVVDEGSAMALDQFVWDHEDMSIVFSAGNGGPGPATSNSPSVAKNNLTSCASANGRQPMSSIDSVASFSSHGPTGDGRFGPDVCTPGQIVTSTKGGTSGDDHYLQGTSMSAPVLTGLLTQVRQYFYDGFGPAAGAGVATGVPDAARRWNPSAALVKATTVNGANRMRGWYSGDDGSQRAMDGQWPSAGQGFGLVNLRNSLYFPGAERSTWFKDVYRAGEDAFPAGGGATREYTVQVAEGQPLDVTLAWTDAPTAAPAGTPALVNNLDLEVVGPGGTYRGNVFNTRTAPSAPEGETPPGTGTPDARNPLERVRIAAPAAGEYTIRVRGTQVLQGAQGFALAAAGRISEGAQQPPQGQPLQVDAAGSPTISDVVVQQVSADTSKVRFTTSEPTTAKAVVTGDGEPAEYADVYTPSNGSRFQTDYQTGPIETSPDYADRPVLGTNHEILLHGLKPGVRYEIALSAEDLAKNVAGSSTSFTSPGQSFQPLAKDIGQLSEGATDNIPSTLANGTGWQTGTQLYAGYSAGAGILGAFMFRMPEALDPAAIQGAVVELTGGHVLASLYDDDPRVTLDLLTEEEEPRWGTQNYRDIKDAPALARVRPESATLRGGGEKRVYTFTCAELAALRESLTTTDEGERRAAFRLDSSFVPGTSLPSYEFGFNRRSKGPELRPKLVLLSSPTGEGRSTTPCDPSTPAPVIDDVGIAPGVDPENVTVSWRTQVPSDSTVLYRERGASGWTQVSTPARSTTHEVQVLGLDSEKEYEFAVRSTACNGRTTTADNGGAGWDFFRPEPPPVATTARWFTGLPTDQASKSAGTPTATFQEEEPTGEPPREQATTALANEDFARNQLAAFWEGPYSGQIDGDLQLSWYWSARPGVTRAPVSITVFADVPGSGVQSESIIGRATASLDVGPAPTLSTATVPVKGAVGERLLIQVADAALTGANELVVHYGSASTPSKVDIPTQPRPAPTEDVVLPLVGPVPPPSAGATNLDAASVATTSAPTAGDLAAGTGRCAPFAADVAPTPGPTDPTDPGQPGQPGQPGVVRPLDEACPRDRVPTNTRQDTRGNTHERAIDCMIWWEIAKGTSSTRYEPFEGVTREQMASFIARLIEKAGGTLPSNPPNAYSDDDRSLPAHHESINKLAAAGLVDGKGGGLFAPKEVVSRAQMAKFIVNAYEHVSPRTITPSKDFFGDDNGNVHEVSINKSAEVGFTIGRNGGYDPTGLVLRDQMASFLARTLDLLVAEGTTPPKA